MIEKDSARSLCARLLSEYGIDRKINQVDIKQLKIYKSRMYGFCNIYSFSFKNRNFLVSDDYSLMDDPKYIKAILEDATELKGGKLIENPVAQSDGAKYTLGLDGTEYYLWETAK